MKTIRHWIAGQPDAGGSSRTSPIWDPASGAQQAEVVLASASDVDAGVAAAHAAARDWAQTSLSRRSKVLFAFRELVNQNIDALARLITAEHGKVLSDARGEVQRGLEVVEFACGIPHLLKGDYSDQVSTGIDSYSFREPLGVVAGITPFNFPAMVPMWMFPLAIACGNAFVLKPSERDPSPSLLLAELWQRAGLPDGVFTVLHGDKEAVDALLDDPRVQAVSFVGSTPIARYIHTRASANGKRVQALGGAKNHAVVLPDADPEFASRARTGPRRVQLFPLDDGGQWVRKQLFGPNEATPAVSPGPRLAAEPQRMSYGHDERWRWVDMARLRGVTPTAVRTLATAYAEHHEHPFPVRDDDRTFDAGQVSTWFFWYDTTRPGYSGPHPAEDKAGSLPEDTRIEEVAQRLRTAVGKGEDLTTETVARELNISADVAARYLRQVAKSVLPEYGLISRSGIAERLPAETHVQLTAEQRRDRVKTLLRRQNAPAPVVTVANTSYYSEAAVDALLQPRM